MRRDAPAVISSTSSLSKDALIDGVRVNAGEAFWVGISYIQNDAEEWRSPDKYYPERFDTKSELFKKPDGSKRNPLAFSPFLGGSRVCLGKSFAETVMKLTFPMYFYFFDFELVNEEQKKVRPIAKLGSLEPIKIPIKFRHRN